jgi:hypothetical protein
VVEIGEIAAGLDQPRQMDDGVRAAEHGDEVVA